MVSKDFSQRTLLFGRGRRIDSTSKIMVGWGKEGSSQVGQLSEAKEIRAGGGPLTHLGGPRWKGGEREGT